MRVFLAVALALIGAASAAKEGDRITSLPGYSGTLKTQYSGYIVAPSTNGGNKYFHYWLQVSESSPNKDPLIFWTNGGPGCSSMDAAFYEQGAFHFDNDSQTLIDNPWRWNQYASILYLEQPIGVGFSYSDAKADYTTNDTQAAEDMYLFIQYFFKAFPEFLPNPFYISGESYAGIYVPMFAQQVLEGKKAGINFQGILVGNGVTDREYDDDKHSYLPMFYRHAFMDEDDYVLLRDICNKPQNAAQQMCIDAANRLDKNMENVNIYDLYNNCYTQRNGSDLVGYAARFSPAAVARRRLNAAAKAGGQRKRDAGVPPCSDAVAATEFFNTVAVQQAIHVHAPFSWVICQDKDGSGLDYHPTVKSVIPIYQQLMAAKKRILVYSGDTDGAVPYTGTYAWLESMTWEGKGRDWDAWTYNSTATGPQHGGTVTEYMVKEGNSTRLGITFVTVKGSGHMVPQMKPEQAFVMFQRFINNLGQQWYLRERYGNGNDTNNVYDIEARIVKETRED